LAETRYFVFGGGVFTHRGGAGGLRVRLNMFTLSVVAVAVRKAYWTLVKPWHRAGLCGERMRVSAMAPRLRE